MQLSNYTLISIENGCATSLSTYKDSTPSLRAYMFARRTTITRWPRRDLGLIAVEVLIHEKKLTMAKITVEGVNKFTLFLADDGGEV